MARLLATIDRMAQARPRWVLTALALLLRAPFVARAEMSVDETRSVQMAERLQGPVDLYAQFAYDVQAPLYPLLTAAQRTLGEIDGRWLRLFPLLASVATVPILHALFRRWLGPRDAFLGGLAAAASSFLIFYAKEARPYALAGFFFAAFLLVAERWYAREGGRIAWLQLPLLALGAVGAHFLVLPTLLAFFMVRLGSAWRARSLRAAGRLIALGALVGLALLPLLGMLADYAGAGGLGFVGWSTAEIGLTAQIVEPVYFLFGNSLSSPDLLVVHLALLALVLPPVVGEIRARRALGTPLPALASTLWWLPAVLLIVAGWLSGRQLLYFPRALLPAAPLLLLPWVLGCARALGAGGLRRVYAAFALGLYLLVGGVVAASSHLHPEYYGRSLIGEFRSGLARRLEPTDLVLVHHEILTSYVAYEWPGPQPVRGLGVLPMTADAAERSRAIRRQLLGLPPGRRVVLIVNGLAEESWSTAKVATLLGGRRPLLATLPCWPGDERPASLLCQEIQVYGRRLPDVPSAADPAAPVGSTGPSGAGGRYGAPSLAVLGDLVARPGEGSARSSPARPGPGPQGGAG